MNTSVLVGKNKRIYIICLLAVLVILSIGLPFLFRKNSYSVKLEDNVEVQPKSQLTYYLNVSYDGVDKNGVKSDSTTVSEITSGSLYVEDKLPDGLVFTGFVTTSDGSIGAVKRGSTSTCPGKVVDDTKEASNTGGWNADHTEYTYHGLHYNANTRTVSFTVKNLKAGCELTVGIITNTPTIDDPATSQRETCRNFYNFASATEKDLIVNSNTIHAYMGCNGISQYNVSYEYTGTVPDKAPSLPTSSSYAAGASVGVAPNVNLKGYTFSGWTSADTTISNGKFTMPSKNVVLKGSFTKANVPTYNVTYKLEGATPPSYILPSTKSYNAGDDVKVDSLKVGDVFNGYNFLGWNSTDITISSDNDFTMPSKNVVITGRFEEVTYKISYQFYNTVLPPNAENYLPKTKTFKAGSNVKLESVVAEPSGYKFLGWYKESEFKMPEEDIVVYGEWKVRNGTFEPTITKEVASTKEYYRVGDVVKFKITVTNPASFPIKDVIVKEENDNAKFITGNNYTIMSEHIANITTIPAGGKVDLYATYTVLSTDEGTIENTASLKGALADNQYELADKEYKANAEFKIQSQVKVCKSVQGAVVPNTFQFQITGTTNGYETWINLENDQCETIYVDPSTYKISEVVPQEYQIKEVNGAISSNNETLVVELGKNYEITYINEFKKKNFFHSFGRIVNQIIQGGK